MQRNGQAGFRAAVQKPHFLHGGRRGFRTRSSGAGARPLLLQAAHPLFHFLPSPSQAGGWLASLLPGSPQERVPCPPEPGLEGQEELMQHQLRKTDMGVKGADTCKEESSIQVASSSDRGGSISDRNNCAQGSLFLPGAGLSPGS